MDPVVIVAAARTPLGAFNGQFKSLSAVELGKSAVKKVAEGLDTNVDAVYMGCALPAGLGQSAARQVALGAGLEETVNCINVNKVCGSGMTAVMLARNSILIGENDIVIAGGMESMTGAPHLLEKARSGYRFGDGKITDHILKDGLMDAYKKCLMGYYAEDTAEAYSLTRKEQDKYAEKSFSKARRAIENKNFCVEITSVAVKYKKNNVIVDSDEIPFSVDLTKIPGLKPSFRENGTITAASASSLSDGAAAVLLMKQSRAERLGLTPLARIVAQSSFSQSPRLFATAPIGAIRRVLEKSQWMLDHVDLFEINEAFAVAAMAAIKEFSLDPMTVNIFGGACALGHPLGASGARILVTLLNALKTSDARRGLAALCVGGGEGLALTVELLR
ncbi:MAG: thiolase family protein [Holosporaceae bacterium]|jgi:acetyl-CoA C-acetyltransferase|nr:thiolase family protein [Holosporaceae bacterium]